MNRNDFYAGARDVLPMLVGIFPFSMIVGVTAVDLGIAPIQAIAMSVMIFAGASQLAAIQLIGQAAPATLVVLTVLIVNLRFIMYSASIAPYFRQFNFFQKGIAAYMLTDPGFAVSITGFRKEKRGRFSYYMGSAFFIWFAWQVGTILGVVVGSGIPEPLSLEFAIPLMFMALLFPNLQDKASKLTACVAGLVAVFAAGLPYSLGIITAALIAMGCGAAYDLLWSE